MCRLVRSKFVVWATICTHCVSILTKLHSHTEIDVLTICKFRRMRMRKSMFALAIGVASLLPVSQVEAGPSLRG